MYVTLVFGWQHVWVEVEHCVPALSSTQLVQGRASAMAKVEDDGVKPEDSASACGEPSGAPRALGEVPVVAADGKRQAAALSDLLSVVGRRTKAGRPSFPPSGQTDLYDGQPSNGISRSDN